MAVTTGVIGGPQFLSNARFMSAEQARAALTTLQAHFQSPGHGSGVMVLHGRTRAGEAMSLQRKSGLQLMFRGTGNERLNDTRDLVLTLLERAGLRVAHKGLSDYLDRGPGRAPGNRIPVARFTALVAEGLQTASAPSASEVPTIAEAAVDEPDQQAVPRAVPQSAVPVAAFTPEQLQAFADGACPKLGAPEEFPAKFGLMPERKLGQGGSGMAWLVKTPDTGEQMVFKGFFAKGPSDPNDPKSPETTWAVAEPLRYERDRASNEANAAYLHSSKRPDLAQALTIVPYERYLVAFDDGGGPQVKSLDGKALRALLRGSAARGPDGKVRLDAKGKVEMRFPVNCLGQLMPLAKGQLAGDLKGTLDTPQLKDYLRSSLEGLKANAALGIVHRDIKPANELFDPASGRVAEIDPSMVFRQSRNRPEGMYCPKNIAGTYIFMHPRALAAQPHSFETDLYAKAMSALSLAHPVAIRAVQANMLRPTAKFRALAAAAAQKPAAANGVKREPPEPENWDGAWLRRLLGDTIRFHEDQLSSVELQAVRALRQDLDDNQAVAHFATRMLDMAAKPANQWVVRTKAQAMYQQLLDDPFLSN